MFKYNPFYSACNPKLLGYEHAWINYIKKGEIDTAVIRPEVAESWIRCNNKIDPLMTNPPKMINEKELTKRIKSRHKLVETAWPFMKILYKIVQGSEFRVDLVDEDGFILKSIGDEKILEVCKKSNSLPGANRSETFSGTTSIGLAILHKTPFQITGSEHFVQIFQHWTCSTAPIFDELGVVIGFLNMAGTPELENQHTLGMVVATAKAISNEITISWKNQQIADYNNQLRDTLETITDGVIYANSCGLITYVNHVMENVLGYNSNELIGNNVEQVIQTSPSIQNILSKSRYKQQSNCNIIFNGKKNKYSGLLNTKYFYSNDGEVIGLVILFTRTDEISSKASMINKNSAYFTFSDIIGKNADLRNIITISKKAAEHDARIIIEGESGTGKEIIAQAIHNASSRKNKPFLAVNCGGVPRELIESELFGYEEGSFTGARRGGKLGKFEMANGGTIFLDEIGDMPIEMQVKILRVLQENKIMRVGGNSLIPINVRVIAATNKNLEEEVEKENFREDLFYRLNVFRIKIPPLRERKSDIPLLVDSFIKLYNSAFNVMGISPEALEILIKYSWPGNIRQLQNVIERAIIVCKSKQILPSDLPAEVFYEQNGKKLNRQVNKDDLYSLEEMVAKHILSVLFVVNNNISEAAKILNVSRTTVYRYIKNNY